MQRKIKSFNKFSDLSKIKNMDVFDKNGNFKAYKVQIALIKLPKKAQAYLKKNYGKKSFKTFFSVVNDLNVKTYEAGVVKSAKFYNIIFDQDGEFYKIIQIQ